MKIKKRIRILFAEDLSADLELALRVIRRENIDFSHRVVDEQGEFIRELKEFKPDLVISDYSMPTFDGMKALQITREHSSILPFIILTGSMNEETAVECMKAGANDYVIKEHINRLPYAVKETIQNWYTRADKLRVEKQLKLLNRAVEQSPVSIVLTDSEGVIEYVNPAFCHVSGYSMSEVIGNSPSLLQSGYHSEGFYKDLWDTLLSGEDWSGEMKNKKKDGTFFWENSIISPITNEKGEIKHFVGVKEDITYRKKMISDLIAAKEKAEESDRLKSAFLANMSHEIRTPMNGILGFIDLLQRPGIEEKDREMYYDVVKKSSTRMLNTLNDLMEISKIEAGQVIVQPSRIDANEMLNYFYSFFRPEAESKSLDLRIKDQLPDESRFVYTDKSKLESIISNLVKNALKFTKTGFVELGCRMGQGSNLEFYVSDSGIGIPAEKLVVIFDRFVQADNRMSRSHEGTGLGLAISKAYAEMLEGNIWIDSKEGEGSVFHLTIPYRSGDDVAAATTAGTESDMVIPATQKNLLVAEDDQDSFTFLEVVLSEHNYNILHAENGEEAVRIFNDHPEIDLVLMDLKMPVMDGYEAARRIREINPDVPIIAQTAFALSGDKKKAFDAGCDDYLTKPILPSDLTSRIGKFIHE